MCGPDVLLKIDNAFCVSAHDLKALNKSHLKSTTQVRGHTLKVLLFVLGTDFHFLDLQDKPLRPFRFPTYPAKQNEVFPLQGEIQKTNQHYDRKDDKHIEGAFDALLFGRNKGIKQGIGEKEEEAGARNLSDYKSGTEVMF